MDSSLQFGHNGKMPVFKFHPSDDHTVITSLGINEHSDFLRGNVLLDNVSKSVVCGRGRDTGYSVSAVLLDMTL